MAKLERPTVNEGTLQSIIDSDEEALATQATRSTRAQALIAWKQALIRRDELRRRVEAATRAGGFGEPAVESFRAPASRDPASPGSAEASPEFSLPSIPLTEGESGVPMDAEKLAQARAVAPVGSRVPEFPYYGPILRVCARLAARVVVFFAGIITVHQRAFNAVLLEFVTESDAVIARLRAHSAEMAESLRRLTDATDRLRRKVEEGEARMLEQELRLADADCDRAWMRLADVESRERLDAMERELDSLDRVGAGRSAVALGVQHISSEHPREEPGPREVMSAQLAKQRAG